VPPASSSKAFDVAALGENSLDYLGVVDPASRALSAGKVPLARFAALPGGQAATFAVGCARQGCRARHIGAFGADASGATVRDALAREGVDVVAIEIPEAQSRAALILVEPDGDRRVFEYRHPALRLAASAVPLDVILDTRLLMVDATQLDAAVHAARVARSAGIPTLVDIDRPVAGCEALLSVIEILVVPDEFALAYTAEGDLIASLRRLAAEFHPRLAVVTCHEAGSIALDGGRVIETPGFAVEAVDTTGAGDAFRAGFASAWLRMGEGVPIEFLLDHGNATAALNCRGAGAQGSLPGWDETRAFVTESARLRSK
jgi:sugar/nucleoside kinase (ribokinase family)